MTYIVKKNMALEMRRNGRSLSEIAEKLLVSKSTASLWCQKVKLSTRQLNRLEKRMLMGCEKGRLIAAETNHHKKVQTIEHYKKEGALEIKKLSPKELLVAGTALYWGEGSKTDKLSFVNSDPALILFMYRWFQDVMEIKREDFMPRIFINEVHRGRIDVVVDFWSRLLRLPKDQFGNPTFLKMKQKKKYDNHDEYYGMLAIRIRNGTNLKYRILGLVEGLKRGI